MNCSANKSRKGCAQGHQPCPTPYTCNYANEAHQQAMTRPLYAPLREVPLVITMEDEPHTTSSESAWSLAVRLGLVAAFVFVCLLAFVPWPTLLTWLAGVWP